MKWLSLTFMLILKRVLHHHYHYCCWCCFTRIPQIHTKIDMDTDIHIDIKADMNIRSFRCLDIRIHP